MAIFCRRISEDQCSGNVAGCEEKARSEIRAGSSKHFEGPVMSVVNNKVQEQTAIEFSLAKMIGPGLLVAAAGIGAGDIVSATIAGANNGLVLLWVIFLAAFLKCV